MTTEAAAPTIDVNLARTLAEPLYKNVTLSTGENALAHADGIAEILRGFRNDPELVAAAYLFCVPAIVQNSGEWIEKSFGANVNRLVQELGRINDLSNRTRGEDAARTDPETARRMLLAMCKDLRVVLLKLASRLQTLRWFASSKGEQSRAYGEDTLALYAPLANRLGIWQIKWELEDLSLRFTRPEEYHAIARELEGNRAERIELINKAVARIQELLRQNHITADVSGRPKHIYSIWKKMQRKHLRFDQLFDIRAVRIIVGTVEECYTVLSIVQEEFPILSKEYDDYIANPKPNGYQSLHTVVTDKAGRPIEIQIRTRAMHEFAELGVAAHWRYKEAGNSLGASAADEQRVAWLRQLLAWRSDMTKPEGGEAVQDDHVYCLTPQGRVVELPQGATPVDFAYLVHTELGHRMKGAKVDGVMVALNYKLQTGQTVEIIAGKVGQPSRDWLNPELGYAASPRTRNKVRQWFNAQLTQRQIAEGRERIDKELARLGKTAVKLDALAKRLGYGAAAGRDARKGGAQGGGTVARERGEAHEGLGTGARRGRRLASDAARALLPSGAARRNRGLRHPRARRHDSPRGLSEPEAALRRGSRTPDRSELGQGPGRFGLSRGTPHRGERASRTSEGPLGNLRARKAPRHGAQHAGDQGRHAHALQD